MSKDSTVSGDSKKDIVEADTSNTVMTPSDLLDFSELKGEISSQLSEFKSTFMSQLQDIKNSFDTSIARESFHASMRNATSVDCHASLSRTMFFGSKGDKVTTVLNGARSEGIR